MPKAVRSTGATIVVPADVALTVPNNVQPAEEAVKPVYAPVRV